MKEHLATMAAYSTWANARLGAACAQLSGPELRRDEGAFFRSVHGTLNHLIVADRIWQARFIGAPDPGLALDEQPCDDMPALAAARIEADAAWERIVAEIPAARLSEDLVYRTTAGIPMRTKTGETLMHVFNHQTHHRGQIHAMLTRIAGEAPPLDLLFFIREQG